MTAITISAPVAHRPRASRPRPASQRQQKARAVAAATQRRAAPMRLTRRGRLLITGVLAVVAITVSLFVGGVGLAGTTSSPISVQYVTVQPGETLWSIAAEVAPGADRRDTVARIVELNALSGSGLQAGQQIAVPTS
jgi:LysM repeat protein